MIMELPCENGPGRKGTGHTRLSLRWIWLAWAALLATAFGFLAFGTIARGDPTPLITELFGGTATFALLVYTFGQGAAALVLVFLMRRRGLGLGDLGFTGRLTRAGALYAVGGWFVAFLLYYLVQRALGLIGIRMFWNEGEFFALDSAWRVAIVVVSTVIVAPVAEELIYRGYVLEALLSRLGKPVASLLSALVFASIHIGVGPGLALHTFLGGLILAFLYVRFRTVYPCVLMHLINNIVAYILIPVTVLR
jgi:hypothetical protein